VQDQNYTCKTIIITLTEGSGYNLAMKQTWHTIKLYVA